MIYSLTFTYGNGADCVAEAYRTDTHSAEDSTVACIAEMLDTGATLLSIRHESGSRCSMCAGRMDYVDYATSMTWNSDGITIRTSVPEAEAANSKTLPFPVTPEAFSDAVSGLQCWADYERCEATAHEEV